MDGSSSYKGKAEGSNGSEGLWIANLTGKPIEKADEILWFESAYDAMAEYQINPQKSVFVSTGGTPTEGQIRGMLAVLPPTIANTFTRRCRTAVCESFQADSR